MHQNVSFCGKKLRRWVFITHQLHERGDFYRKRLSISTKQQQKNTRGLWKATAPFSKKSKPLVGFCYKRGDDTLARWWQLKDFLMFTPDFGGKFNDPILICGYLFQMGWWKTTNYLAIRYKDPQIHQAPTFHGGEPLLNLRWPKILFAKKQYPPKVMGWNLRGELFISFEAQFFSREVITNIPLCINKALLEGGMMVSVHETPWVSEFGGSHGFPRGGFPGWTRYLGTKWHSFTDRKGSKLAAFTFEVQLPPSGEGLHDVGQATIFVGFSVAKKKHSMGHGTGLI